MLRFLRRIFPFLPSPPPLVTLVRLEGVIARGSAGGRSVSHAGVEKMIEKAFARSEAKAVAVVINSPGGSAVQSRMIHDQIRSLAQSKDKPVLVFCEDVAASGGYMLAIAGDEIFADANSIIGSIGVVSARFGFTEAIAKLGLDRRVQTAGENKVRLDPFVPEKAEDVAWLESLLLRIHDDFIALVKERRAGKLDAQTDFFQGDVWTGKDAFRLGLIDGLGHPGGVLKEKFGDDVVVATIKSSGSSLIQRLLGAGASAMADEFEARLAWGRFGL